MEDNSNEEVAPVGRLESFIFNNPPMTQRETFKPYPIEEKLVLLEKKNRRARQRNKGTKIGKQSVEKSIKRFLSKHYSNI